MLLLQLIFTAGRMSEAEKLAPILTDYGNLVAGRLLWHLVLSLEKLLQIFLNFLKKGVDKSEAAWYYVQALSDSSPNKIWASGGIGRLARFRF